MKMLSSLQCFLIFPFLFRLAFVFFAGGCVDIMYFRYHLLLADYHEEDSHFTPSSQDHAQLSLLQAQFISQHYIEAFIAVGHHLGKPFITPAYGSKLDLPSIGCHLIQNLRIMES